MFSRRAWSCCAGSCCWAAAHCLCCSLSLPQLWPGLCLISLLLEQLPVSDRSLQPTQTRDDSFTKYFWERSWAVALLWFYTALTALLGKKWLLRRWWVAVTSHLGVKFFSHLALLLVPGRSCHCRVNKAAERGSWDWGFLPSWLWMSQTCRAP